MEEISYNDELISAREATGMYAFTFDDLMKAADRGLVRRYNRKSSFGSDTYLFRRGDIIELNKRLCNES